MGGTAASRLTATVLTAANQLGATGGVQTYSLGSVSGAAENAAHGHTATDSGHAHTFQMTAGWAGSSAGAYPLANLTAPVSYFADTLAHGSFGGGISNGKANVSVSSEGSGTAHQNTQPTIILNYIIRAA
jgi:microcystin-dependent protein